MVSLGAMDAGPREGEGEQEGGREGEEIVWKNLEC